MMLRIRLDINNAPIGTIGVWNTEERRHNDENDAIEIRYQVHDLRGHDMWGGHIEDFPHLADVWHDQEGDAATLTAAVMEEVGDEPLIPLTDGGTSQYQDTGSSREADDGCARRRDRRLRGVTSGGRKP